MANEYTISKIKLPNGDICNINDVTKLPLTGGTISGNLTTQKFLHPTITGTGTAAVVYNANTSTNGKPALWRFNLSTATPQDGDIITITTPEAGHGNGVFVSTDNGTTYKPVNIGGTYCLTTHFSKGTTITLVYDSDGTTNKVYPVAGAPAPINITGGCWRVLNFYDSNTTYSAMSVNEMKTGTATSSRAIRADYLKTFLSTLGGTNLTLTHDATNGLVLNHDSSGVTPTSSVGFYKVKYDARGHITDTTAVEKSDITNLLGLTPTANTGTVTSITPGNGLISGTSGSTQTAITTSGTISIGEGKVTNAMLAGSIANEKLSNSSIKIGNKTISLGGTATLADIGVNYPVTSIAGNTGAITADTLRTSLGLSNAMHFLGITTTNISTGTANTTATVTIGGSNITAAAGDVVLYGSQEYVWGNSKWNLLGDESSYLLKSGGTMTGQLLTSFKNSVAIGSLVATSTTIPDLCEELRYSSGCMGSFQLTTAYTLNDVKINNGWYNFIWIPHRSGGNNGAASMDNCNYGTCYLSAMDNTYAYFVLRFGSGEIKELLHTAEFVSAPTDNQVVVAYGVKGRVKTSGYTISANVPSDAVFTDTKVAQTASTTANWRKVILGHNQGTSSTIDVAGVTEQVYGSKYISAQPSTGTLRASIYRVEDKVELQWNETDQSLDFVFI